jgi:phage tail sheath protein FI
VGLLSVPISAELNSDYLNEVKKYRNELLNANTSYAALYTPHLKISDRFNDREIYVSPTGYVAGCISDNEQNREIWYAPAGPKYGVLNVLDVARRYDEGELDDLYNAGINPIDFYEGRGIRVWGQKTLQSSASALDRLNVRLMLIVIEPAIAEFLEDFLFDQNDDITRRLVTESIKSYMEGIKARRGVYAYDVKCDSENNTDEDIDANQMNVWLYVQPTKTVEYIKFRVIITRTGASFSIE